MLVSGRVKLDDSEMTFCHSWRCCINRWFIRRDRTSSPNVGLVTFTTSEFGSRFHSPSQKGHENAELPGTWRFWERFTDLLCKYQVFQAVTPSCELTIPKRSRFNAELPGTRIQISDLLKLSAGGKPPQKFNISKFSGKPHTGNQMFEKKKNINPILRNHLDPQIIIGFLRGVVIPLIFPNVP